ncbi:hypothetical protein U1Q18_019693 [Sarracenia purpurea var. burkii]
MEEESHDHPLAPSTIFRRSDEEFSAVKPFNSHHHQKSNKCLVYILAGIVLQAALLLIFASAVLSVENPNVTLRSVAVENLGYVAAAPSLNVTLVAEMSVKNNNFGQFKYENSTVAFFLYQNVTVGIGYIDRGLAGARATKRLNVTVEVTSNDELLRGNRNFSGDLSSGLLELTSYAKLIGRVHVMKIINKRASKLMNCTMNLDLTTKAIQDLICM